MELKWTKITAFLVFIRRFEFKLNNICLECSPKKKSSTQAFGSVLLSYVLCIIIELRGCIQVRANGSGVVVFPCFSNVIFLSIFVKIFIKNSVHIPTGHKPCVWILELPAERMGVTMSLYV